MLGEALAKSNPLDELLELSRELYEFERRFGMGSEEFYARFQRGELDDELQHQVDWAGAYYIFMELKKRLEAALIREAVQQELRERVTV